MTASPAGPAGVEPARVARLNARGPAAGDHVLYWMQQSQRAADNPALEYAAARANALDVPLLVGFGLTAGFPEANRRHYHFLLGGLRDVAAALARRKVPFVVRRGDPAAVTLALAKRAAAVVCDRGYLRIQKQWRERVAAEATCEVVQVEGDVVVPVEAASAKAEIGARSLRPKLRRLLDEYLVPLDPVKVRHAGKLPAPAGMDLADADAVLAPLDLDTSVGPVPDVRGGEREAKTLLGRFLRTRLPGYADHRGKPGTDFVSHMSKYLHFGQISPVAVALAARAAGGPEADAATFLEELIVRRELAQNYVHFTPDYDRYASLPAWARATLAAHADDPRPYTYTRGQLEAAATHDPYWNAAMREMTHLGYTHNHMRMYWGKKILEWSATPEDGFDTALRLNNKFFLDGRDANSFANVAWVFGNHDRPWPERPVFGNVRSMTAGGLERKNDVKEYVRKVDAAVARLDAG